MLKDFFNNYCILLEEEKEQIVCNWCLKLGKDLFSTKQDEKLRLFCSEVCFSQWRRTLFKKKRVK